MHPNPQKRTTAKSHNSQGKKAASSVSYCTWVSI
jgi:hypothetical protein